MPLAIVTAIALTLLAATLVYAGARHQRLRATDGSSSALRWAGVASLLLALGLLVGWFGPATAVFVWLTLAMLVWSIVPLAAAWRRRNG